MTSSGTGSHGGRESRDLGVGETADPRKGKKGSRGSTGREEEPEVMADGSHVVLRVGNRGLRSENRRHFEKKAHNLIQTFFFGFYKRERCVPIFLSNKSPKSKPGTAWGSLLETQTGFHAWNDLAFGVTKKTNSFVVRFIRVLEFSPESFEGVLTLATNAVPKRIVCPDTLDFFHK